MSEKNVIVDRVEQTATSVVGLGRKVAAQWLRVGREALDAAAESLKSTSETLSELSKQIEDNGQEASKQV